MSQTRTLQMEAAAEVVVRAAVQEHGADRWVRASGAKRVACACNDCGWTLDVRGTDGTVYRQVGVRFEVAELVRLVRWAEARLAKRLPEEHGNG
jgi:hypothetical protein